MKVVYFVRNLGYFGGIKIMIQHVRFLQRAGIESKLFVLRPPDIKVYDVDENLLTSDSMVLKNADILITSSAKDVKYFYKKYKNHGPLLCHLCQAYEPTDLKARISGESIPQKYKCMAKRRKRFLYILKFLLRVKKIERIYSYHTIKIAVSQHLKELIEKRYKQKCYLVPNGIDGSVFHPPKNFPNYSHLPIKILCVGSIDVAFKGIPDTLEAINILKHKYRMPIEFIRVSPIPISSAETESRIVDRSYHSLSEQQMADLYREADIFISSSLEGEGFGLPAIEAMSCGTPCVLTEIRSYQNFDRIRNFAFFVPTHQPLKIAEAVKEIVYDRILRGNLIKRGFEIAEKFSLENTAKRLLKVVHEIILNEGREKVGRVKKIC